MALQQRPLGHCITRVQAHYHLSLSALSAGPPTAHLRSPPLTRVL